MSPISWFENQWAVPESCKEQTPLLKSTRRLAYSQEQGRGNQRKLAWGQEPSPHQTPAPDPLALEQLPTRAKAGTVRASEQLGEMEPIKPSAVPEEGEGNHNQGVSKWGRGPKLQL